MKRILHVFISASRLYAHPDFPFYHLLFRRIVPIPVIRAFFLLILFTQTAFAASGNIPYSGFGPGDAALVSITLGDSPVVCQGTTVAELPYTEVDGTPLPDEYSIDFDAAAEAAGFADVAYTTLPFSPVSIDVPSGAPPGVYNASIRVRNSLADESDPVAFTVTVVSLPAVTLSTNGPLSVGCGDIFDVTIAVESGFTDISTLQYSVEWDETKLMYIGHTTLEVGGAGGDPAIGDINVIGGELTYNWLDPGGFEGEDLANGTTLLTLSFLALDTGGGSVSVSISGSPLPLEVTNSTFCSDPVTPLNNANITLLQPPTLLLSSSGPAGASCGDMLTVMIAAESGFTEISTLQYSVEWDETELMYLGNVATQIGGAGGDPGIGDGNVAAGELTYNWLDPAGFDGENLGDGTVLLELTFLVLTGSGSATVDITTLPLPLEATTATFCQVPTNAQNNAIIVLTDTLPPIVTPLPPGGPVTFTDTFVVNASPGSCSQSVSWYRPSALTHNATGNCSSVILSEEQPIMPDSMVYAGDFFVDNGVVPYPYDPSNLLHQVTPVTAEFPIGTTVLRYYFSDLNGNYDSVIILVTVLENQPPIAVCEPGLTLPLDAAGNAVVTAVMIDNGSSDNCGIAGIVPFPASFTCADIGVTTVNLTVTDFAGNTDVCNTPTTLTIVDNLPPEVNCPNDLIASTITGACTGLAADIAGLNPVEITPASSPLTGPGQFKDNCGVVSVTWELSGATVAGPFTVALPAAAIIPGGQVFNKGVTFVTYTFKDAHGNSTTCSFDVTVDDQVAPAATCPPDVSLNVNTGGCIAQANWAMPSFTDNCTGAILVSSTHNPGSFFFFGTTVVTYSGTDLAGNVGTCSFNVVVNDLQAPVAKCKDISVQLGADGTVIVTAGQVDNGSSDNCFYTYLPADLSWTFDCTDLATNPNAVTLTIVDGQNPAGMPPANTASCQAKITVTDMTPPVIANCAAFTPAVVNLDANCSGTLDAATFAANFTITDNTQNSAPACPLAYQVDVDGSGFATTYPWSCADAGSNTVTFQVSDVFGNTATCVKTVTVQDVTPPVIIDVNGIAPPVVAVGCDDYDPNDFATLGEITAADVTDACDDNCNEPIDISFADTPAPGACATAYTVTRTWTVSDQAGNSVTHVQVFNIGDTEAPVFTGIPSLVDLDANDEGNALPCLAPFTFELLPINVSDNCADLFADLTFTYVIDFPAGADLPGTGATVTANFPIGASIITLTATDPCGNTSQTTITVNVSDVDGPGINEPFAAGFGNLQKVCDSTFTVLNITGSCGNNFSWYRPFRADNNFPDCSGHNVTESISDLSVQSSINISAPFIYTNPPVFSVHPTAFFPVGNTVISYTATDDAGNSSVCSFTVKVTDTQAPAISCPGNQTLSISSGCAGTTTVPNYSNSAQVADNCLTNIILSQNPAAGTVLSDVVNPVQSGQTFTVTLVATDSFPNNLSSAPCTFTVTLFDGAAPVPDEPVLPAITSFCGIDTVEAPSATDCDGSMFVTIYGTPSVSVIGILPPLAPGGPPRYIIDDGNYAITWSYTDAQNNTTSQLQSVQIFADNVPPIANCAPAFSVNLSAAGDYALSLSEIDNGSFDQHNCGPISLSLNPVVLTCANLNAPVNVILNVKDVAGNVSQCVTAVTVHDITAPVLSPVPANTALEACAAIPAPVAITAVDFCDQNVAVTYKQDTTVFVNAYTYTLRRTWTATDDSGNVSTGIQTIQIADTEAPLFAAAAPDTLTVFTDPDNLNCKDTVAIDITPFVSDCDSTTFTIVNNRTGQGAVYSEILPTGTYTLVFSANDGSNNASTHLVILIVKDGTKPIAACINGVSVSLQASGTVTVNSGNVNASSSDNCTAAANLVFHIQRLDPPGAITTSITFDCNDADGVTQHPVKLFVQDQAGNESSCQTYIVVQDNVFPVITTCPPNKTLPCTADLTPSAQGTVGVADNCGVASIDFADSTATGAGNTCIVLYRTWKVLDQAGNLSTCVQVFDIQDTIKPVFTLTPNNITISCSDALVTPPNVGATDNCDADVDVTLAVDTVDVAQGNCGLFSHTVRRTWTATDNCGRTNVHTQLVTVTDVEPPVFLGMPDTLTVNSADYPANQNCTVPVTFDAGQFLTDCQPDSLLTVSNNAPYGDGAFNAGGNYPVGEYWVVFTATDACGNAGSDSILIIVQDNSVPTVVCNDNVVISLGANGSATLSPDDIDLGSNDNCGIDTLYLSPATFDCSTLGIQAVTLTVTDQAGNSNFCTVNVDVTLGQNAGFTLNATGSPESWFGADDGSAVALATGGSGQFGFIWDNGANTPAISGLSAGVYIVTVKDSVSGCIQTDTAVVLAGEKINLSIGDADGCPGQTVSIPVTVDHFFDVTGFLFTLHVTDPAVAGILGITAGSIDPAIAGGFSINLLPGNDLGISWIDTSLTLPDGTVLFHVDVQFGAAPLGSTSLLAITSQPFNLLFTQDSSGVNVVTGMVDTNDGALEITCNAPDFELGGDIQTWKAPTKPVPGVEVSLSGILSANQTTGAPGTYLFGVPDSANATVKCFKDTPGNAGITGVDVLLIKRHVLGIQLLTSPYQFVAADVSAEGNISLIDYARIQEVALGTKPHITNSPDWKFIPKSYVFPAPNPLSVKPPDSISHTPVDMSYLDDDFVAVRMGDINGSITPSLISDDIDDRAETFRFRLDDRSYQAGEIIEVPFKAIGFNQRSGYQMTIDFDPNVFELEGFEAGVLPEMGDANFGANHVSEGRLTTLWVTATPLSVADGEVLFTLTFKVLRNGSSLSEILRPGSQITRAEAYDRDGNATKLDFEFVTSPDGATSPDFALYQNQPNPFNDLTTIGFRLPETGRTILRVFNASGQLVKTVVGSFDKGYNEVNFRRDEFGAPGVYYYELETPKHSDRKKMILM